MNHDTLTKRLETFGLTTDARDRLLRLEGPLRPYLDLALDELYASIADTPDLAAFFTESGRADHARDAQRAHWMSLLSGRFDESYSESALRIGRVHCDIGLKPHLYLTGYAQILSTLVAGTVRVGKRHSVFGISNLDEIELDAAALVRAGIVDIAATLQSYFDSEQARARSARLAFAASFRASIADVIEHLNRTADSLEASGESPASEAGSEAAANDAPARIDTIATAREPAKTVRDQLIALQARTDDFLAAACAI